jgi:hypothetical protein
VSIARSTAVRLLPIAAGLAAGAAACVGSHDVPLGSMTVDLGDAPSASAAPYTGELGTGVLVQVSPDGRGWYNLGGRIVPGPAQGASVAGAGGGDAPLLATGPGADGLHHIALQGAQGTARVNSRDPLPADTYRHVRLWLGSTYVKVTGTVGGTTYDAESIAVAVRAPLVIQRQIEPPVRLADGSAATLVFDLNTESWLTAAALSARRVDTALVKAAATVSVR